MESLSPKIDLEWKVRSDSNQIASCLSVMQVRVHAIAIINM